MDDRTVEEYQREIEILKRKLERSQHSRSLIEQAKDHYDLVYRSSIRRLARQKELLDRQNAELDAIRLELLKSNRELVAARRYAEQANEAKSHFLASMSHEIRTPLNGILGFLELMEATHVTPEQRIYLREAVQASQVLLYLINDILDFSKIESGQMRLESIPYSLKDVIEIAETTNRPLAFKKEIQLKVTLDPHLPDWVIGDSNRLLQILNNLLSNGIKFTPRGTVHLQAELKSDETSDFWIRFSVTDTGLGMTEEQLERIFKPFEQANSSIPRQYGGSGLGLAISKQFIEMMGGTLGVHSLPSQGSTFWFEIPATAVHESERPAQSSATQNTVIQNALYSGLKVLLAEDNETNTLLMRLMLEQQGIFCDAVVNGEEAVRAATAKDYDLILMDCRMPIMDGYEATRIIRKNLQIRQPIIVALTANALPDDKKKCFDAGMDEYLTKPISIEAIQSVLTHYCQEYAPTKSQPSKVQAKDQSAYQIALEIANELEAEGNILVEMMSLLLDGLSKQGEELLQWIYQRDEASARSLLHTMTGASGNMRLEEVYDGCGLIGNAIRDHSWSEAQAMTEKLLQDVSVLKQQFREEAKL